jgi:hypothetical protein
MFLIFFLESTLENTIMDGWCMETQFSSGSCSTANLPIARDSKIEFIQLDDLKVGNGGGAIVSAAPPAYP